jgi:hypothetical protein
MAQYSVAPVAWTTAAFAASTALTDTNHVTIRNWATNSISRLIEVYVGGLATSSVALNMTLRRNATQGATPTNVAPAAMSSFSAAAATTFYVTASTDPVSGAVTQNLLQLGMNGFGGVVRWVAAPGEEIYNVGATGAAQGEISLSATSGASSIVTHEIFEEM